MIPVGVIVSGTIVVVAIEVMFLSAVDSSWFYFGSAIGDKS